MASHISLRRIASRRTMLALAFTAVALLVLASALATSQASEMSSSADRVRAIERTRLAALVRGDTATARSLIADDFQLINPGGATLSRDDYMAAVQAGDIDYLVFEPVTPMAVRMAGDSASLRFEVNFDLLVGGMRFTHQAWVTELYELRQGRWQIVWEQATAIPNDFGLFAQSIMPTR